MKISIKKILKYVSAGQTGQSTEAGIACKKGFSLPELIIVIGIFAIVTTIAMFDQARLNSNTLLTNMAYEIALAVREAQVYGIGVRGNTQASTVNDLGLFSGQYGTHFNINSPREVIVFGNNSDDYVPYTPAGEDIQARIRYVFENQRGNFISAICVGNLETNTPVTACVQGSAESTDVAEVVFRRPVPAPNIYKQDVTPGNMLPAIAERVYVVVHTLDRENCRVVVVEPTGQIRVVDASSGLCVRNQ